MRKVPNQKLIKRLNLVAKEVRQDIVRTSFSSKSAHIAASLSAVDILVALYFEILKVKSNDSLWSGRDRFILSKGHGCLGLYATLTRAGFLSQAQLKSFCRDGGCLGGHPEFGRIPGLEASTGSLGHGLSIGEGMALSFKHGRKKNKVFVLLGDGECNEGSIWEAAMSISHFKLDNICAIIDYNKLQATGRTEAIMALEPFKKKWEAFGWQCKEINGHRMNEILAALKSIPFKKNKPSLIIAHTVKGKGISFMENKLIWHYRPPNEKEMMRALKELSKG
ncbi:MAG: transketolase [Candidatus Omnitrophica bacterium]|nr:transketolase [Candidatus Omnitrophota bacterium]